MVVITSIYVSASVLAATGIYIGSGNVYYAGGDMNYEVRGYVYYNSNTSTALNLSSLSQWIYNYGIYPVNEVRFEAHDGIDSKHTTSWGYISEVTSGNNRRVEADWETICLIKGYDSTYQKNSSSNVACTDICSGYNYAGLGGWASYWYQSYRTDNFHY